MLTAYQIKRKRNIKIFIFLAAVFTFIMFWACIQPLNASPDEAMRYQIVDFIVRHGYLPDGRDPEIINETWGISYGFYPILSYMIMAIPAKIVSLFTTDQFAVLIAARTVNAVFGTVFAFLVFKISEMLFEDNSKYLFTVLTALLPGVIFVHSYVNNDSMALLATAWIAYAWIKSLKEGWTIKICIHLAAAISVCALSYYNAYGFILVSVIFFFTTILIGNKIDNKAKFVAKRTALIIIIVLVLAGWWFIRNYMLYGDLLGSKVIAEYSELYAAEGFKPSQKLTLSDQGIGVLGLLLFHGTFSGNWTLSVIISFIGTFGFLNIFMPDWITNIYIIIFAAGTIGVITMLVRTFSLTSKTENGRVFNKKGVFNWCMLFVIIITIALLIYYNLYNDFQPQGRYLLPMVIPFMYFITLGTKRLLELIIKKDSIRQKVYFVLSGLFVLTVILTYVISFYPVYVS